MVYQFNDSEKFRANMMFVFGIACMSPPGFAVHDFIVNENLPSFNDILLIVVLFTVGFLLVSFAYSIMYLKDKQNV